MRKGNRLCGASFAPLGLFQLTPVSSATLFLLACVAGKPGARPTVYVRGIIRISYGAGRGRGQQRWVQRRELGQKEIDGRERRRRVRKTGRLLETCLKIKVSSWPRLIFHHTAKLKMWTVITYLSNCLTSKGGCHFGFTSGQVSQQAGRKKADESLLIPPNALQNYIV